MKQTFGSARRVTSLQGWYRFLDPKFKAFSRLFSKTIFSFSRLKVIKQVINRDLKNAGTKLFL